MTSPIAWEQLPAITREFVQGRVGVVVKAEPVTSGRNHHLAAVLHTQDEAIFLKGVRTEDRRARRLELEAAMAATVTAVAPQPLWHIRGAAGWDLLAVEAVPHARHAILNPATPDLHAITDTISMLGRLPVAPPQVTDRIERRWAEHADADDMDWLRGGHLLHTDLRPDNVLIGGGRAWIVDWSWPTLGAAWLDPACLALWLIVNGHHPAAAERWLATVPAGREAPPAGLDAFVRVTSRLWSHIAGADAQEWKVALATAANRWCAHRTAH